MEAMPLVLICTPRMAVDRNHGQHSVRVCGLWVGRCCQPSFADLDLLATAPLDPSLATRSPSLVVLLVVLVLLLVVRVLLLVRVLLAVSAWTRLKHASF